MVKKTTRKEQQGNRNRERGRIKNEQSIPLDIALIVLVKKHNVKFEMPLDYIQGILKTTFNIDASISEIEGTILELQHGEEGSLYYVYPEVYTTEF